MNNQVKEILEQLDLLAKNNEIEIQELAHHPLTGGYQGHVILEGVKNNFLLNITIDLDFPQERDGVILSVNPYKKNSHDVMGKIKDAISNMRNNFYIPLNNEWVTLISKEIKIRTDFYN